MPQYIDKATIVAEIEKRRDKYINLFLADEVHALSDILEYINTLDVKEVDLEKEIHSWMEDNTCRGYCSASIRDTAEHFYELGLKTKKGE